MISFILFANQTHIEVKNSLFIILRIIEYYQSIEFYQILYQKEKMDSQHQSLKKLIQSLLIENLPEYIPGDMKITQLCGATNETFKIQLENNKPIVFRILSSIVDTQLQGKVIKELSKQGTIPKCYYTCLHYRIQEFVENVRHPQPSEMIQNEHILKAIIQKANTFHQIKIESTNLQDNKSRNMFSQQQRQKYEQATPYESYDVKQYQNLKQNLLIEFQGMKEWLDKNFSRENRLISFCHNDLNNANIFIQDLSQVQKKAIFIDFDYIGNNYVSYDLANFLNESCFQYGGSYPGFKITRRVTKEVISKVCSFYKSKYEGLDKDIGKMLILVNYYWALWSILIKPTSSSPTFCPLKHGIARMELMQYYKTFEID